MVELIDDKEPSVHAPCKPFAGEYKFNATAAEMNRDAEAMAAVRLKYPYPPTSCEQALTILQNLEDEIKTDNERIASGASNRVAKRHLDSLLTVKTDFKNWVNARKCIENAIKQEDQAFNDQLQSALNQETANQKDETGSDNWIIFGSLGLLLLGAIVIIIKKSSPKSSA